jgi:RHH-type proline utilization regulon transcriptional repressor/proline dehydrogenase/delta 1-pyrroline-5-carboxylate dehydrogenase
VRSAFTKPQAIRFAEQQSSHYGRRMSPLQAETEQRGMEIFRLVDRHPESIFSKSGFYQRMMALSMKDEHFKVQMFRFVDVLASIHRPKDIVQHFDEYLSTVQNASRRC